MDKCPIVSIIISDHTISALFGSIFGCTILGNITVCVSSGYLDSVWFFSTYGLTQTILSLANYQNGRTMSEC